MIDNTECAAHELFERIVDEPEEERDRVLAQEGIEPKVAARVRALLVALDRSSGFLEAPALSVAGAPSDSIDVPGYMVKRVIASGGMATVYEARQLQPERLVAIKVMHRALANATSERRFRYESEILARLRHPNIAAIFEAGACVDGSGQTLPFFAMELVQDARSIVEYAREQELSVRESLELFMHVCEAVHHGHRLGVLHRDLKPSNILVGGDGRPLVIDFGVARSTMPNGERGTEICDAGQLVGTLHAMSPEQCLTPDDVDARTDVYSLGAVLYQLLVGRAPLDLSRKSIPEAVRAISHDEPVRPVRLRRELGRDLDAITLMALAKNRDERYAGVDAMAADIRRYLRRQPVEARPISGLAQLARLAERNRHLSCTAAAAVVLLIAGAATSSYLAVTATRARDAARERGRELEAVVAFQEDQLAGIDAPALGESIRAGMLRELRSAAHQGPENLLAPVNFTTLAVDALEEHLLKGSRDAIDERFAARPLLRARLLQQLAGTTHRLGLSADAEMLLREALELRREHLGEEHDATLQTMHALGSLMSELGRYSEAIEMLELAHKIRAEVHGADDARTLSTRAVIAGVLRRTGDLIGAERVWRDVLVRQQRVLGADHPESLRTLNNVGVTLASQGRFHDAEVVWRELVERRRIALGTDHPDYRSAIGNLGALLHDLGEFEEARSLIEASLASARRGLGDRHPDTLLLMGHLALLEAELGHYSCAADLQRSVTEGRLELYGPEHPGTLHANAQLASIMVALGDAADGERLARSTLESQRLRLGPAHTDTIFSATVLCDAMLSLGRMEDALAMARDTNDAVRSAHPPDHWIIADTSATLGHATARSGDVYDGLRMLKAARDVLAEKIGPEHPRTRRAARLIDQLTTHGTLSQ